MSIFTDEYGNARPWVNCTGFALTVVVIASLVAGAACWLWAVVLSPIGQAIDESFSKEPEYETITIRSKKMETAGMDCVFLISLSCSQRYNYYVNDMAASERVYNTVEEGKVYKCRKQYPFEYSQCDETKDDMEYDMEYPYGHIYLQSKEN